MDGFHKLARRTLSDSIVADLRQKIDSNELPPGTKLPNEMELASVYGVGRGVVREAVKALSLMRLLDRSTAGTFVALDARHHVPEVLITSIQMEDPDFVSLYESRILLEKEVVRLACQRGTKADLVKVRQALSRAETASTSITALEADLDYHRALSEAAHSPVLSYLYTVTTDAIAREYRTFLPLYTEPHVINWGFDNHKQIVDAIEERDSDRGQRIAEDSLKRAAETARSLLRESRVTEAGSTSHGLVPESFEYPDDLAAP